MAIYGEEDWTALSAKYKEDAEDAALAAAVAMPSRDKLEASA